jgi:serine/threonine-protein phosphatase 2A regulatory subunit B'
MLMELDHDLFQECKKRFNEDEAKKKVMHERRELIWRRLDDIASTNIPYKTPSLIPQSSKV